MSESIKGELDILKIIEKVRRKTEANNALRLQIDELKIG